MQMHKAVLLAIVAAMVFAAEPSTSADFREWKTFKGTKILKDVASNAYCYKTTNAAIDADGAPNAYHPDDVGKNCYRDKHLGLDCPANAGYPNSNWWSDVLVTDPSDPSKPYVQRSGAYSGFYVAMTWLQNQSNAESATDPARYVDSTKIPYIVFPGSKFATWNGTGTKGDVGWAYNTATGKSTGFVVADQGGGSDAKLGEASIALFEALGGRNLNARTGEGVAQGEMVYVVFPGSHRSFQWPKSVADINTEAQNRLRALGGETELAQCR